MDSPDYTIHVLLGCRYCLRHGGAYVRQHGREHGFCPECGFATGLSFERCYS